MNRRAGAKKPRRNVFFRKKGEGDNLPNKTGEATAVAQDKNEPKTNNDNIKLLPNEVSLKCSVSVNKNTAPESPKNKRNSNKTTIMPNEISKNNESAPSIYEHNENKDNEIPMNAELAEPSENESKKHEDTIDTSLNEIPKSIKPEKDALKVNKDKVDNTSCEENVKLNEEASPRNEPTEIDVETVNTSIEIDTYEPSRNYDESDISDENEKVLEVIECCKHPLENTWSFWLQANKKKEWTENLVEITTFDTVEDFWCLNRYTKPPSELLMGQDYAIFKKGIQPMWEDPKNKQGGRWLIMIEKGNNGKLDRFWLDTVLMVIGENFEDNNSITGVVVNVRVYSKIGIWTIDHSDSQANMRIAQKLKAVLALRRNLEYTPHNTSNVLYVV